MQVVIGHQTKHLRFLIRSFTLSKIKLDSINIPRCCTGPSFPFFIRTRSLSVAADPVTLIVMNETVESSTFQGKVVLSWGQAITFAIGCVNKEFFIISNCTTVSSQLLFFITGDPFVIPGFKCDLISSKKVRFKFLFRAIQTAISPHTSFAVLAQIPVALD